MSCSPRQRAFTLLELIVVIVVLGVLAAIAVPTFAKVIDRSKDESVRTTAAAILREASALGALEGGSQYRLADLDTAVGDTSSSSPDIATNGGGEVDANSDGRPDGWSNYDGVDNGTITRVPSGSGFAVQGTATGTGWNGPAAAPRMAVASSYAVPLQPSTTYVVTARVKAPAGSYARLYPKVRNSTAELVQGRVVDVLSSGEWVEVTSTVSTGATVPSGSYVWVSVGMYSGSTAAVPAGTTFLVDDVTVRSSSGSWAATSGPSTTPGLVSTGASSDGQHLALAAASPSGRCVMARSTVGGPVRTWLEGSAGPSCTASEALLGP